MMVLWEIYQLGLPEFVPMWTVAGKKRTFRCRKEQGVICSGFPYKKGAVGYTVARGKTVLRSVWEKTAGGSSKSEVLTPHLMSRVRRGEDVMAVSFRKSL